MRRAVQLLTLTFVLLLAAVVGEGIVLHRQSAHVGHVAANAKTAANKAASASSVAAAAAREAKKAAAATQLENAQRRELRNHQLSELHAQAVTYCNDLHGVVDVFERYLDRAITAPSLTIPDLTPDQKKALSTVGVKSLASQKELLSDLRAHDCRSVKRLPTSTQPKENPHA